MMYEYEQPLDLRLTALNLSLNNQHPQTKPVVSGALQHQQLSRHFNQIASHQQPKHQAPPEQLLPLPIQHLHQHHLQHHRQHQHQPQQQQQQQHRLNPQHLTVNSKPTLPIIHQRQPIRLQPTHQLHHQHSLPPNCQLPQQLFSQQAQPTQTVNSAASQQQPKQQLNQQQQPVILQQKQHRQTGSPVSLASVSTDAETHPIYRQSSLVSRFHCKPCGIVFSQLETLRAHQESYCSKRDKSKTQARCQSAFSPQIMLSSQSDGHNSNSSTNNANSNDSSNSSSIYSSASSDGSRSSSK